MMFDMIVHIFAIIIVVLCQYTSAWVSPATTVSSSKSRSFTFHSKNLNVEKNPTTTNSEGGEIDGTIIQDDTADPDEVKWGVSYIGGDPCGSKYNDDPFDKNPSDKPGFPDDMKARIEALAQQKLRESKSNN